MTLLGDGLCAARVNQTSDAGMAGPYRPMRQPAVLSAEPETNPALAATTQPQANIDAAWSTHRSPTGHPYYYNSITKVSTYTMPDAMRPRR